MQKTELCPRTCLQPSQQHGTFATSATDAKKQGKTSFISMDAPLPFGGLQPKGSLL